jgi:hypothetical protein
MNTNYETTLEATFDRLAEAGLIGPIDVLASAGVAAELVYDGDAEECPHCAWQALSAAA